MRLRVVECSQSHLDKCAEHRLLGSQSERFTEWRTGDFVLFVIEGAVAALAKVRGLPYEEKRRIWPDDVYPFRIPVELELMLAPGAREALPRTWSEEQRLIPEPQAEQIISRLRGGKPMKSQERLEPPAPAEAPRPLSGGPEIQALLRNCPQGEGCGQSWSGLVKTELPDIRFCPRCDRVVYLCVSGEALLESLRKNRCVAIPQP
jgi:hypothetical protein